MPWREADDDLDDAEYPDELVDDDDDGAEGDGDETVPCPECRRPVFEGAGRCPGCGRYLSRDDAPGRRPWWLVLGVFVCLAVVLGWVIR
jgi:hypothetical protein